MSWLKYLTLWSVVALGSLCLPTDVVAQCPTGYPFADNCPLPASGLNAAFAARAQHVVSNVALLNTSTVDAPNGIWRDDYAIGAGAPPLLYQPSNVACSLNSGNGDNGSQVKSADNKCWLAAPSDGLDIREFGVVFDGTTDNSTALTNAFAWWAAGRRLRCAPATQPANFGTGISVVLGLTASATFDGAGADQCRLTYTGSGYAITVDYGTPPNPYAVNSTHWRGFSLLTNGIGTNSGITLKLEGTVPSPANSAVNTFEGVVFRGVDVYGGNDYFATAVNIVSVSNVNFDSVNITGSDTGGVGHGIGVNLTGTLVANGGGYAFDKSVMSFLAIGIVNADYAQGIMVASGAYVANVDVIKVTGAIDTGGISIGAGAAIYGTHAGLWDTQGTSLVSVSGGATIAVSNSGTGILLDKYRTVAITGINCFAQTGGGGTGTCIALGTPTDTASQASIIGNTFQQTSVGVSLAAASTGAILAHNGYYGVATKIVNNATGVNYIEDDFWRAYTPTLSCGSGALGTGNAASGTYKYLSTKTVHFEVLVTIGASGFGTCNTLRVSTPTIAANLGTNRNYIVAGKDESNGKMVTADVLTNTAIMNIVYYDNTQLGNNSIVVVSGTYQSQ